MKKTILIALSVVLSTTLFAQLSEKEKKALQKEMLGKCKAMDAEDLEEMYNEYPAMKGRVTTLESKVTTLEDENMQAKSKNVEYEEKIAGLEKELEDLKANGGAVASADGGTTTGGVTTGGKTSGGSVGAAGLVYKVQIGAFTNKNLSKYFNNHPNFGGEVDPDGTQKFTIGQFKGYWEADTFKKYMREMGVKDAWVVAYKDGKRLDMKDAREMEARGK